MWHSRTLARKSGLTSRFAVLRKRESVFPTNFTLGSNTITHMTLHYSQINMTCYSLPLCSKAISNRLLNDMLERQALQLLKTTDKLRLRVTVPKIQQICNLSAILLIQTNFILTLEDRCSAKTVLKLTNELYSHFSSEILRYFRLNTLQISNSTPLENDKPWSDKGQSTGYA